MLLSCVIVLCVSVVDVVDIEYVDVCDGVFIVGVHNCGVDVVQ